MTPVSYAPAFNAFGAQSEEFPFLVRIERRHGWAGVNPFLDEDIALGLELSRRFGFPPGIDDRGFIQMELVSHGSVHRSPGCREPVRHRREA